MLIFCSGFPSLLKKPFFLLKEIFCLYLIMKIILTPNIHVAIGLVIPWFNSKDPVAGLSQNIRFQKLSLLSRDLIKPIISLVYIMKYQFILLILSRFRTWRKTIRTLLVILIASFSIQSCFAEDLAALIAKTEQEHAIPSGLLKSIASVESGNKPYALNISGRTIVASSKEEAVKIVRAYQANGVTNIDLGLAQINLYWHGENFKSIEEMLEPKHNLEYAAKFLSKLYQQHGSWNKAVRHYHSANPLYHIKYSRKVLISWLSSGL
jgi:soluble lytic murein transglycosylase-like protein